MKFGEQPTYSRQAYEDTEKGIQDVKDAAKGNASVEDLRTLVQEKKTLESQKADLYDQAFDEATEMDRERDALAQERIAKEAADTAEADRLRAEILGESAVHETASVETDVMSANAESSKKIEEVSDRDFMDATLVNEAVDVGDIKDLEKLRMASSEEVERLAIEKLVGGTMPEKVGYLSKSERPIAVPNQAEVRPNTEASRGFFDKVKSFFSGEKQEESKESLVGKLKDFLGKPKENGEYRDMVDGQGNFDIKNAYSNIKTKQLHEEQTERNIALGGATATFLSGSSLVVGAMSGIGLEGGTATVVSAFPLLGTVMTGSLYAVPAVGIGAAAAWGGVKLWNMYKRRKALRAADELFIRQNGGDVKDSRTEAWLADRKQDFDL